MSIKEEHGGMSIHKVIAIDPGLSGAVAIFSNDGPNIVTHNMPDDKDLFELLQANKENSFCFIEKVSSFVSDDDQKGKKFGIQKMLANYEKLVYTLKISGIPYIEVHPATWQGYLNLRVKGEDKRNRKLRYKKFAESHYPVKVTLKNADALCLVEFGRRKLAFDQKWVREKIEK